MTRCPTVIISWASLCLLITWSKLSRFTKKLSANLIIRGGIDTDTSDKFPDEQNKMSKTDENVEIEKLNTFLQQQLRSLLRIENLLRKQLIFSVFVFAIVMIVAIVIYTVATF